MSKSVRLSESLYNKILWIVAVLFAAFLIGLGGKVIESMPKVEPAPAPGAFVDARAIASVDQRLAEVDRRVADKTAEAEQAMVELQKASREYTAAAETFSNWIATRKAVAQGDQNPEVIARTHELDRLKAVQLSAQSKVASINESMRPDHAMRQQLITERAQIQQEGFIRANKAGKSKDTRVFLYRLALTLPLLGIAAWLFKARRKSKHWPFVWGFTFFAGFTFFFELVPYMPDYGGFVRYVVGIAVVGYVGHQTILALNRYREQQSLAEQKPDEKRRADLDYDVALSRLAKGVCPGCERHVNLGDANMDFCHHCGIALHANCGTCTHRSSAFSKFCQKCGAPPAKLGHGAHGSPAAPAA